MTIPTGLDDDWMPEPQPGPGTRLWRPYIGVGGLGFRLDISFTQESACREWIDRYLLRTEGTAEHAAEIERLEEEIERLNLAIYDATRHP